MSDSVPVIPPLPKDWPPLKSNPTVAKCGECGLEIKLVMGYVCINSRCPVWPKCFMTGGASHA